MESTRVSTQEHMNERDFLNKAFAMILKRCYSNPYEIEMALKSIAEGAGRPLMSHEEFQSRLESAMDKVKVSVEAEYQDVIETMVFEIIQFVDRMNEINIRVSEVVKGLNTMLSNMGLRKVSVNNLVGHPFDERIMENVETVQSDEKRHGLVARCDDDGYWVLGQGDEAVVVYRIPVSVFVGKSRGC